MAPATRTTNMVVETFERDEVLLADGGPDCWYVSVEETYSGDRPDFRTERLELQVHDEDGTVEVAIELTPARLLSIGLRFAHAAEALLEQERLAARRPPQTATQQQEESP